MKEGATTLRVRSGLALLLAVLALALPAAAATPALVIQGDKAVAGLQIARGTAANARARFGAPSSVRARLPHSCFMRWNRIGLSLTFLDLSEGRPCRSGVLVTATVTSRAHWRTALGLRVGDSIARLERLFPRATLHRNEGPWTGYWLITRRTCAEVGGQPFPGLLARVRSGRVSALVSGTTACE